MICGFVTWAINFLEQVRKEENDRNLKVKIVPTKELPKIFPPCFHNADEVDCRRLSAVSHFLLQIPINFNSLPGINANEMPWENSEVAVFWTREPHRWTFSLPRVREYHTMQWNIKGEVIFHNYNCCLNRQSEIFTCRRGFQHSCFTNKTIRHVDRRLAMVDDDSAKTFSRAMATCRNYSQPSFTNCNGILGEMYVTKLTHSSLRLKQASFSGLLPEYFAGVQSLYRVR